MTNRIHPITLPFKLPLNAENSVDRLVHAYIVMGEQLCVVDTGVAASHQTIVAALAEQGKSPGDVAWIVNTHAHPDHAGGNRIFHEKFSPQFACHPKAARWIENMALQAEERPVFAFDSLVAGSAPIARMLEDGDELDLGGITLQAIFTPGHSPGMISLFCSQDGTLLTGDTIPPTNGLPLYFDLAQSRQSLQRLLELSGVKTMYHSHISEPYTRADITRALQDGLDYLDRMDEVVAEAVQSLPPEATPEEITRASLLRLGFDPPPVMPLTVATIKAHLNNQ
jgi:glyoxylase-like metal-dependent hydrolase (beta-lactamase superfamily II)